jgi:hypothetical protein
MTNGDALGVLQAKLAENAADLIQFNLVGLKELVGMIQSLENPHKGDEESNVEERLQRFLRGEDVEPPAVPTPRRNIQ